MGSRPGLGLGGTAAGKEAPVMVVEAAEGPGAAGEAAASGEEGPAALEVEEGVGG